MSQKALEGLKILDFTAAYSGPIATMQLADFGADVLKIEHNKYGDGSRTWEPQVNGHSLYFLNMNRNKRSITLNLKSDEAKKIVYELVKKADVVVESFRPGVMSKMGFSYETLKAISPKLIMASLSGYGQTGPYSKRAAYSNLAEALSGMMYVTGFPDSKPTGSGVALGDSITGMFLANGILTALHYREKTGEGQYLEVAMTDALVHMLAIGIIKYAITGEEQERIGNRDPAAYPYDLFEAKDGYCMLGYSNMTDWTPFVEAIEMPELLIDPRFATNADRIAHADELFPIINAWSKKLARKEIAARITAKGELYSDVLKPSEVMENEQFIARDMIVEVEDPYFGTFKMQGIPVKMSKTPGSIDRGIPGMGEHTSEVLTSLGYMQEEIDTLKTKGVI
jgi:crotonobetainyl-CoA:carnitine CoA-transferase CaiB-like acyl-CoA transferase